MYVHYPVGSRSNIPINRFIRLTRFLLIIVRELYVWCQRYFVVPGRGVLVGIVGGLVLPEVAYCA